MLSIIIPVLNEGIGLADSLQKLVALRSPTVEIIVVDGGSCDDTLAIAAPFVDQVLQSKPGRATQMNYGARHSHGQLLWFLHCDSELPSSIPQILNDWQKNNPRWGFFPVQLSGKQWLLRWVERGINWRSRVTRVATGDQGIFVDRRLFNTIGGYPEIALMEDVALSKTLRRLHTPYLMIETITTSSRRWEKHGIVRTILLMWWLRLQYACGVSPDRLVKRYYPKKVDTSTLGQPLEYVHNTNSITYQATLIQMAKSPSHTQLKTRLSPVLSLPRRQALQAVMINHTLNTLTEKPSWRVQLFLDGELQPDVLNNSGSRAERYAQAPGDLGARMQQALQQALALQSDPPIILVGSDCPFITSAYIESAITQLTKTPVVIGPALDGGYVLLGISQVLPPIFDDMPWGTAEVLAETLRRLERAGIAFSVLEPLSDIDLPEDLSLLASPELPQALQQFALVGAGADIK